MKLILSDRTLALPECGSDVEWIDLSKLDIANCVGCFGCWTRTPGKCVIRDDAVRVYPRIAESGQVMYISRIRYGGYDTPMKTMLERAIPIQQAFIRLVEGETHHVQRRVVQRALFRRLVARNARNMNFERHRVVFAAEQDLEQIVREEVLAWEASC